MLTQQDPRFRKRFACRLRKGGSTFSGVVLNVSRGGMFVQTSAVAMPGEEVEVAVSPRVRDAAIAVNARVVWQRKVPSHLRTLAQGGVGLQIDYAPEAYFHLLANAARA